MDNDQNVYYRHVSGAALPGQNSEEGASYEEAINNLALDVLNEARTALMMSFRFMDTALWKMPTVIDWHPLALATDGHALVASPLYVLARFQESPSEMVRDYLHMLLHCIFRHPLDEEHINVAAWSLACDIVVESIALEMTEKRYFSEGDDQRQAEIAAIETKLGHLSPAKLYRIFADAEINGPRAKEAGFDAMRVWDLRQLFQRDCHDLWANKRRRDEGNQKSDDDEGIRKRNLSDRLQDSPQDNQVKPSAAPDAQGDNDRDDAQNEGASQESDDASSAQDDAQTQGASPQSDASFGDNQEQQQGASSPQGQGCPGVCDTDDDERRAANAPDDARENDAEQGDGAGIASDEEEPFEGGANSADAEDLQGPDTSPDVSGDANAAAEDTPNDATDDDEAAREAAQQQMQQQLEQLRRDWEDIAKQIEMDVQSFSQGNRGGKALCQNLAIANRRLANYHDFLRQFATMGEDMKINDDEFDYIYYTYGINTYGNMPLVEPLEYQESYRVREFVIVLDTSGSCSGELIRNFVTRTYDILRETEGFGDKVNIHLIQCDNKIQADLKIECVEDLEKYCREFQAFGFGGTDFRPVFEYVDEMCESGEFENLRGLIYFTDGRGTFPAKAPAYETAFVFVDDGANAIDVPPWAMKVIMDEEEILGL